MGSKRTRQDNIHELHKLICSIKSTNGDYDDEILEDIICKFCYDKGIRRVTANEYIKTLKGAGLLKL